VDVEDGVRELIEKRGAQQPHEADEAHELDAARLQGFGERAVVVGAVGIAFVRHDERVDAGAGGALEAERVGFVRDDDGDAGSESAVCDGVDDGLQVGAATRNQNADRH
jgi:hypothetical protein